MFAFTTAAHGSPVSRNTHAQADADLVTRQTVRVAYSAKLQILTAFFFQKKSMTINVYSNFPQARERGLAEFHAYQLLRHAV